MKIAILGAGKLGRALSRALAKTRHSVRLVPAGRSEKARFDEALLVIAVRDPAIFGLAERLAQSRKVGKSTAVVHLAGASGPELLTPLSGLCAGIGQAHPMLAFASPRFSPTLRGAHLLIEGDAVAVRRASTMGRAVGLVPRRWKAVDRALYHAAGGLVANGSAAIAAAGARLLALAGAPEADAARVLGPLLRSVAENVEHLGFPDALTGPIRRGDVRTVEAHLAGIRRRAPDLLPVFSALARLQIDLAARIAEASEKELRAIGRLLPS